MFIKNRIGLSSIVAVSLLILVSVMSFIYIFNWFSIYDSNFYTDLELAKNIKNIDLKYVSEDYLVIDNDIGNNVTFSKIQINGIDCNISGIISEDINRIFIGNCTKGMNVNIGEVILFFENNILSETVTIRSTFIQYFFPTFEVGSCGIGSTRIYGLESMDESHAEISSASNYTYNLCIDHNIYSIGTSCSGNFVRLFYLDDISNSHIYINNTSPYGTNWQEVCVSSSGGSLTTSISNISPNIDSLCVGSIDTIDNVIGSHIGDCSAYTDKIWLNLQ